MMNNGNNNMNPQMIMMMMQMNQKGNMLGLHFRLSRDAKPFKQRKPLLSLSWLSRCLAHDVAHQDFVVFNTFCHDFSEVLKSCHLHAAGHLVKALG